MVRFLRAFRPHFEHVVLIGRVFARKADTVAPYRADDDGVSVVALPPYERVHNLALRPWAFWPATERALLATLPTLDALWLNFGHPVSYRALQICAKTPKIRPFAVLRGHYDRDAAFRAPGGRLQRKLTGMLATNLLNRFARLAVQRDVPCVGFGTGPRLKAYGLRHIPMVSSLLDASDLQRTYDDDVARADLLVVGRLAREKGVDLLLKALVAVPGATLRVVGGGEEESALRTQARVLGIADRVWFDGPIPFGPKLFARYQATSLVVIPSRTEGAPKAAFEAMAFGKPVVASRVGGLPDIIGANDERGALVTVGDTEELAKTLQIALHERDWIQSRVDAARAFGREVSLQRQVAKIAEFVSES